MTKKAKVNKSRKLYEQFESCEENGPFTKFAKDMENSEAWSELSTSQIGLYHILKNKFTKKDGKSNVNDISFPKNEWIKYYSRKPHFDKDMDRLIELGFIRVVLYQGNLRKPTIYGFSEQWKYYNTAEFNVTDKDMRTKGTLSEEHKKAISDRVKEINSKRHSSS